MTAGDDTTAEPDVAAEVVRLRAEVAELRALAAAADLELPPLAESLPPQERRTLPPPQMTDKIRAWRRAVFET